MLKKHKIIRKKKMKVIIAAYIYNKKLHNKFISWYTWIFNIGTPPVSHVEILLPLMGKRMFFSSTNRDGSKGTRWAAPEKVIKHPERWKFYEKKYNEKEVIKKVKRADSILACFYDWLGIGGFATPLGLLNDKEKWYCSEAVWFVLIGIWKRRISPRRLIREVLKIGFKEINHSEIKLLLCQK